MENLDEHFVWEKDSTLIFYCVENLSAIFAFEQKNPSLPWQTKKKLHPIFACGFYLRVLKLNIF